MRKCPLNPVKVYLWTSSSTKELYIFDTSGKAYDEDHRIIPQNIYNDDSIENTLSKIGLYLKKEEKFKIYAWSKKERLIFDVKNKKWKGYNINPFLSSQWNSEELKEPIEYKYHDKKLFSYSIINIVFANNLPNNIHKYYFTSENKINRKQDAKREDLLNSLCKIDESKVELLPEYYTRVNYYSPLKTHIDIAELFDKAHTSQHIDVIQWIEDTSKILYKVSKRKIINKELFANWTNVGKINKYHVVNMYSIYNMKSVCKIIIEKDGVHIHYILDARQYVKKPDLEKHLQKILSVLTNILKQKIILTETSLNVGIKMNIANSSYKLLTEKISKQIDIFNIVKNNSQYITCTYKRSSNYTQNTEIYEYIRSRLNLGITNLEIADELTNLGINGNVLQIVNEEIDIINQGVELNERESIKIKDNGTIITIGPRFYGYDVSIINSNNTKEMNNLIYWLTKIVAMSTDTKKVPKEQVVDKVQEIQKSSKSSSSGISKASSLSSENSGGAPIKKSKKDNYLITMLQQTDKELFGEYYARNKCQSHVQPVVFSKEHKKNLEKENKMIFDNVIEYGSSVNNLNYYACPKLWCPQSKIPLSLDGNQKCPIEDEEPIKMYKDIDKNKPSYVKLIKPNDKGMCVPCCGKNKPQQKAINNCMSYLGRNKQGEAIEVNDKKDDENYLINHTAPISVGRYGTIPENLHDVLSNDDYKDCFGSLKTKTDCFIRKGVKKSKNDSIIHSVMEIFKINDKKEFRKVLQKLTFVQYLALDNGKISKAFMNIGKDPFSIQLEKEMKKNKIPPTIRNMHIYLSMKKYIDYILTDDMTVNKSPEYIIPLFYSLFKVNIIIWEKNSDDSVYMICNSNVFTKTKQNTKFAMIIKEGEYYEPLVLKKRSTQERFIYKLEDYKKIDLLIDNCGYKGDDVNHFNNLYRLNNWVENTIQNNKSKFRISKILLNDDLSINKLLTEGNIFLKIEKIGSSYINRFIQELGIKPENIIFINDVIDKKYKINVFKTDLEEFVQKASELGVKVNIGQIEISQNLQIYSILQLQHAENNGNDLIIHANTLDDYHNSILKTRQQTKKWYELKKMVVKTIIKKGITKEYAELFRNHPEKEKIKIILEEIPKGGIEDLKKWLTNTIVQTKYDYLSDSIVEKDEFIFSQNALVRNGTIIIPQKLIQYHKSLPTKIDEIGYVDETFDIDQKPEEEDIVLPRLFDGNVKKLNTKWNKNKKNYWSNMGYIDCKYDKKVLGEFVEWYSTYIGNKTLTFKDVKTTSKQLYYDIMNDTDAMYEIFHDTSYYNEWVKRGNKYSTINLFMEKYYNKLSDAEKRAKINDIHERGDLWPTDLEILTMSKLLNVTILVIQRGVYGNYNEDFNRGDLQDLLISSKLFEATNMTDRPVLIFNKVCEKNSKCSYYLVVDKSKPQSLYISYSDIPEDIKKLVNLHMNVV
jgi:hypothetical protein